MLQEEKRTVPYRFSLNSENKVTEDNNLSEDVRSPLFIRHLHENNINEILELTKSIELDDLAGIFQANDHKDVDLVLFGTADQDKEKNLLKYLMCLRHGLDRDSKLEKRILFQKINDLINLISRDTRWPEKLFNRKCKRDDTCQCDGEGKGCRTKRITEVSLMRLQILKNEQSKLRQHLKSKYVSLLEKPKKRREFLRISKAIDKKKEKVKIIVDPSPLLEKISEEDTPVTKDEKESVNLNKSKTEISPAPTMASFPSVSSIPKTLTPPFDQEIEFLGNDIIADLWGTDDNPLQYFDTSIDINVTPVHHMEKEPSISSCESIEKSMTLSSKSMRENTFVLTDTSEDNHKTPSILLIPPAPPEKDLETNVEHSLPTLLRDKPAKKSKKRKEKKNMTLPNIQKESVKKKTKRKKHALPKLKIDIPKELRIEEKIISPKLNKEIRYEPPRRTPKPRKPKYLEIDLGIDQPIFKIFLEKKECPNQPAAEIDENNHVESLPSINPNNHCDDVDDINNSLSPTIADEKDSLTTSTSTFKLEYSSDCVDWVEYTGDIYQNYHERDKNVALTLGEEIEARYVRIYSKQNQPLQNVLLRVEREDPSQENPAWTKIREILSRNSNNSPVDLENVRSISESIPDIMLNDAEDLQDDIESPKDDLDETCDKFQDDLVVNIKSIIPPTRTFRPREKVSMFPDINTETPSPESPRNESAEERRNRRLLLNRKRVAKQKLDTMMNMSRTSRKGNSEEVSVDNDENPSGGGRFQDKETDFLRKYCIITKQQREWYEVLFKMYSEEKEDDENRTLSLDNALHAINMANRSLVSEGKVHYIISVMALLGAPIGERIDFRTFMLLVAFAEKVLSLGKFFQLTTDRVDYANLLTCLVKAKQMYQIMLRAKERTIHVEDFLIELQAANISLTGNLVQHILKNNEDKTLDFLDYLTYFPLFLHTHNIITDTPVS